MKRSRRHLQTFWAMPRLCIALGLLFVRPTEAMPRGLPHILQMLQKSDAVVVGQVVEVKEKAHVVVEEVLKGAPLPSQIEVAPVRRLDHVIYVRTFQPRQQVILFLMKDAQAPKGVWRISENGWGTISLRPETKSQTVAAVKQMLALPTGATKSDYDLTHRAMLGWATSDNAFLRTQAHSFIVWNLSDAEQVTKHKAKFLDLLVHPDPEVRAVALQALRSVHVPEALPLFIQASRDSNERVVHEASMALATYDTPASVAALIALTQHPNPDLRVRALIDLDNSRQSAAKAALVQLLDDPHPRVRAMAPRGLVMWLRNGEATEVIPRILQLLDDPVPEVQIGAAWQLGESRHTIALQPLLKVLERPNLSEEMERAVMTSLGMLLSNIRAVERRVVDDKMNLIIAVLERGRSTASLNAVGVLALSDTPQAIATLQRAAQTHPLPDIRDYAKRMLPKPESAPLPKK